MELFKATALLLLMAGGVDAAKSHPAIWGEDALAEDLFDKGSRNYVGYSPIKSFETYSND